MSHKTGTKQNEEQQKKEKERCCVESSTGTLKIKTTERVGRIKLPIFL